VSGIQMIKRFNRYEIKYILTVDEMFRVIEDLGQFMRSDPYAISRGGYAVSSLYYDSRDYECYRSKMDGIKYRRKIRIRRYPGSSSEEVFLEIKQRINKTVQKRRARLSLGDAYAACEGRRITVANAEDQNLVSEIQYLHHCLQLRRACLIKYHRRAFQGGRFEPGLRVTFDTNLRFRVNALDLETPAQTRFFLPPDACVLEVKANERVPIWLTSILARHQCTLSRISKYCLGLRRGFENLRDRRTAASGPPRPERLLGISPCSAE